MLTLVLRFSGWFAGLISLMVVTSAHAQNQERLVLMFDVSSNWETEHCIQAISGTLHYSFEGQNLSLFGTHSHLPSGQTDYQIENLKVDRYQTQVNIPQATTFCWTWSKVKDSSVTYRDNWPIKLSYYQ